MPRQRSLATPAALLLMLALLVRALVPGGWMPVASAHGVAMTICTGSGAMPAPGRGDHPAPPSHESPCAFAAVAAAPLPLPAVLPPAAMIVPAAVPPVLTTARIGEGLGAPPRPATGPPAVD